MEFNNRQEKVNPLEKALVAITKEDDLKNIGDLFEKFNEAEIKVIDSFYTDRFISQLHPHGVIALVMLTPIEKTPSHILNFVSGYIYSKSFITEVLSKIPENYQYGIAMRYVKAAYLCNKGLEAINLEGFVSLYKSNPTLYTPPILFIHAQVKEPLTPQIQYRKDGRIDTITLYYLALNFMLKKDFQQAEFLLTKAFILSKSCKDVRPNIINKLSLASFLNRTPKEVFCNISPQKHFPKGISGSLWALKPIDPSQLDSYYREFEKDIVTESARRIILDYAETSTAVSSKDLAKACGIKPNELQRLLSELGKSGDLSCTITQDGNVQFTSIALMQPVNTELVNVTKLFKSISGEE